MSKVALVTDSTAYIPDELLTKYNITVTPQILIWGDETFEDGVDIKPTAFYQRLKNAKVIAHHGASLHLEHAKGFYRPDRKGL